MSRKRKSVKKDFWKDLSPMEKYFVFAYGEDFAKSPDTYNLEAHKLAFQTYILCNVKDRIPTTRDELLDRFKKWDSENLLALIPGVMNLIFDCHSNKSGNKLHALADAIDLVHRQHTKDIEPERAWLMAHLYGAEMFPASGTAKVPKKLFSDIREAFSKQFPDSTIEDSTLRTMLKELGYDCRPDKPGPKRH